MSFTGSTLGLAPPPDYDEDDGAHFEEPDRMNDYEED